MAVLNEGDFELDGYRLGKLDPVFVESFSTGVAGIREQDTVNPVGDDTHFGVDYLTGPTWTFTLGTNGRNIADATDALDEVADVWVSPNRRTPGAVSTLRWMRGGVVRRAYGRPRKFAPIIDKRLYQGYTSALVEFKTQSPFVYDDMVQSLRLDLVTPSTGGVRFPATFPLRFASSGERQGIITGGGKKPAPFEVTFHAPNGLKDPYLRGDGWDIPFTGELAYDETITVNTRTREVTAPGNLKLSRKARLSGARINPGSSELFFGAIDPSATAYADIEWHRTYTTF